MSRDNLASRKILFYFEATVCAMCIVCGASNIRIGCGQLYPQLYHIWNKMIDIELRKFFCEIVIFDVQLRWCQYFLYHKFILFKLIDSIPVTFACWLQI